MYTTLGKQQSREWLLGAKHEVGTENEPPGHGDRLRGPGESPAGWKRRGWTSYTWRSASPDFDTPSNIVDAGSKALSEGFTHYGPSPGLVDVRDRIAREVSDTRGISVAGDNVVVTPGGKPIMFFTMLALVDEGDEVLYPNPGFPIYESMIRFVGGVPVPMRLYESRGFNIDVDEVAGQVTDKTRLMVVNSPNNPCGSIIAAEDLEALADLARDNGITVLSDEIYSRFLYEGEHTSLTAFPGMREQTIILDGFSKTYAMTGLANRLRRHAHRAGRAHIPVGHQQRLLHRQLHTDRGGGGHAGASRRRRRDGRGVQEAAGYHRHGLNAIEG